MSKIWHADGTFYASAKYFNQLYVIHAYFPRKAKYDEQDSNEPWVKKNNLIKIFFSPKIKYYYYRLKEHCL